MSFNREIWLHEFQEGALNVRLRKHPVPVTTASIIGTPDILRVFISSFVKSSDSTTEEARLTACQTRQGDYN
jgi:hypothetical protein